MYHAGQTNWCSTVVKILSDAELTSSWHAQSVEDQHMFLRQVKEKLYGTYIKKYETQLHTLDANKKLRVYKDFKKEFSLESYLLNLPSVT